MESRRKWKAEKEKIADREQKFTIKCGKCCGKCVKLFVEAG
jgi:hypothetical protein